MMTLSGFECQEVRWRENPPLHSRDFRHLYAVENEALKAQDIHHLKAHGCLAFEKRIRVCKIDSKRQAAQFIIVEVSNG